MKILYLGLDPPAKNTAITVTHWPLIRIVPRQLEHPDIARSLACCDQYTHLIFTSKSAVAIFFDFASKLGISASRLRSKIFVAVGKKTAEKLHTCGMSSILTAEQETAEGVQALLETLDLSQAYLFWPHAALARPLLADWLQVQGFKHQTCVLYDTFYQTPTPMPHVESFDEIVFTSPSTVDAFCRIFGKLPCDKRLTCIGPITQRYLNRMKRKCQ